MGSWMNYDESAVMPKEEELLDDFFSFPTKFQSFDHHFGASYYDHFLKPEDEDHLHDPVACLDVFLSDPFHTAFVPGLICNSGSEIWAENEIIREIRAKNLQYEESTAAHQREHHSPAPVDDKPNKKSETIAGNQEGAGRCNCPERLSRKEISQYFYIPIAEAARELNVGVTLLKKRCRELGIRRWPHRKLMSLQALINNVQEMGKEDNNGERNEEAIKILEQQMRQMEEVPDMDLEEKTKRLRQACFKANYMKRRVMMMDMGAASSKKQPPMKKYSTG